MKAGFYMNCPFLPQGQMKPVCFLFWSILSAILPLCTFSQGTGNQWIPSGSYVIAMDNANQSLTSPAFNIRAYGLANELLQNHIPLKWIIDPTKQKDSADFVSNAERVYPLPATGVVQPTIFKGGPFVIDSLFVPLADSIILAFGGSVAVFELKQSDSLPVAFELIFSPRIALISDGGNAGILTTYMDSAGIDTAVHKAWRVISSAQLNNNGPNSCFTFAANGGMAPPGNALVTNEASVFLNNGGNFLAQNTAIGTYENLELLATDSGVVENSGGINFGPNRYHQPSHSLMQFEGSVPNYVPGYLACYPQSGLLPGNDTLIIKQNTGDLFLFSRDQNPGSAGGRMTYLPGQNYALTNLLVEWLNGMRIFFNAMLEPSGRDTLCGLNFASELELRKDISPGPWFVGDTVLFSLSLCNSGPGSAYAIEVADPIPNGLTFVDAQVGGGTYNSSTGLWKIPQLGANLCDTLWIRVQIGDSGSLMNRAELISAHATNSPANDADSVLFQAYYPCFASAGNDTTICDTFLTLNATPPVGNAGTWSSVSPNVNFVDPNDPLTEVYKLSRGVNELIWVVSNGACSDTAFQEIYVPDPTANAGADSTLCENQFLLGAIPPDSGSGQWNNVQGGGVFQNQAAPGSAVSGLVEGTNILSWTVTHRGCTAMDSLRLEVLPRLVAEAAGDDSICGDAQAMLIATPPSVGSGTWIVNQGTGVIADPQAQMTIVDSLSPGDNEIFWVVDSLQCFEADTVHIYRGEEPTVANAGVDQTLVSTFSTQLDANFPQVGSGFWSIVSGGGTPTLSQDSLANTTVTDLAYGENQLVWSISNPPCPVSKETVRVLVVKFALPDAISPNGDGTNDVFVIPGLENFPGTRLQIFNRWGNQVYFSPDYQNDWGGEGKNGSPLSDDTYYLVLQLPDGTPFKTVLIVKR